jgi:acyl-coenzyme A thioesterase PaaI-like protein
MTDRPTIIELLEAARGSPPDERTLARRRAADALRQLIAMVLGADAEADAIDDLARQLEELAERTTLEAKPSRYGAATYGPSVVYLMNETHPIGGTGNPIAAPLSPTFDGTAINADFRFGIAHEGTPGLAHGGFVAATFDHLLGGAAIMSGQPIVTGTLTVRYLRPTPINTDLSIRCWLGDVDGRRVSTHGVLRRRDDVLAEADATFITVDETRYTPADPRHRYTIVTTRTGVVAVCQCGWRSQTTPSSGIAGSAWDDHNARAHAGGPA